MYYCTLLSQSCLIVQYCYTISHLMTTLDISEPEVGLIRNICCFACVSIIYLANCVDMAGCQAIDVHTYIYSMDYSQLVILDYVQIVMLLVISQINSLLIQFPYFSFIFYTTCHQLAPSDSNCISFIHFLVVHSWPAPCHVE